MTDRKKIQKWAAQARVTMSDVQYLSGKPVVFRRCGRCGGTGYVWATHVDGGRCFACGGAKGRYISLQGLAASARARDRRDARFIAANRRGSPERLEKRRVAAQAARSFLAQHVGLAKALAKSRIDILRSFALQLATRGSLSEKQVAAAFKVASDIAKNATLPVIEVPEGRQTVEGEIISIKEYFNSYTGGTDLKMLVLDPRGFKVFGSIPRTITAEAERGVKVRFDARLKAKELGFGFFKRPTNAEVIS
jgi:hypothetical protein